MNKNRILVGMSFFAVCLTTSCNAISINRVKYNSTDFNNATKVLEGIKSKQKKDNVTALYDKGTIKFRRKVDIKGTVREDEISFHNVNIGMSSGFDISWSLSDKYLKIDGENETIHFLANAEGNDVVRYFKNKAVNGTTYYFYHSLKDDMVAADINNYKDYFVYLIDYYTATSIPTIMSLTCGVTGESNFLDPLSPIVSAKFQVQPDYLLSKSCNEIVNELSEKYKDNKDGYKISINYGSNDDSTLSASLKGKIAGKDAMDDKYQLGYFNFDNFVAYKNNFIVQIEYKIDGKVICYRDVNTNLDVNCHIIEDITEGKCEVDKIDFDKYKPD